MLLAVVLLVLGLQKVEVLRLPSMEKLQWDVYHLDSQAIKISLSVDSKKLWLGTFKGLFEHDTKTGRTKKRGTGLFARDPRINNVLADGKGGVWFGTDNGLAHVGNFNEGPVGRVVHCMVMDGLKGIWFATDAGLQYLGFNGERRKFFNTDNSRLPSNGVGSLIKDGQGGLWINANNRIYSNHSKCLTHLKADGSWEIIDLKLSKTLERKGFTGLARDGNRGIWIGISGDGTLYSEGGLVYFDLKKRTWTLYTKSNSGFPSDSTLCLESDGKGGVWIGTTNGLAHFSADKNWRQFNFDDSRLAVYDIKRDVADNVWVATSNGYARFRPFTLRNIPKFLGCFFSHKKNNQNPSWVETATDDADSTRQSGSVNFSENDRPLLTFHNAKRLLANKLMAGKRIKLPESAYFAAEKSFYSKLLEGGKYDVLVVPFQTQYNGVDQIGRSFMTYRLALEIEAGTKLKVAPVNLVYRALGSRARYYQEQEVYELANKLGVSRIIWGYAGIKGFRALSVCVAVQTGTSLSGQSNLRYKNFDLSKVTFTHLPFQTFSGNLNQIMAFLQLPGYKASSLKTYSILPYPELPSAPTMLFDFRTENPLHRACYFQLLGLLTPESSEYIRNYFFIRSLVAISQVSPQSVGYNLIEARALLYLYRRPAAMKIFESPKGIEEQALLELLNGNLTELAALVPQISSSIMKLLSEIELVDLKAGYSMNLNQDYSVVTRQYPQWEFLLTQRMAFTVFRRLQSNLEIKNILDLDFPLEGYSVKDLKNGAMAAGETNRERIILELAYFDHIRQILKRDGDYYLSLKLGGGPDRYDYLMMLSGKGQANLLKRIRFKSSWRKKYSGALALLDVCSSIYKDHPSFLYQKIWAQYYLPARKEIMFKNSIETEIYNNILKILWYSGGLDSRSQYLPQFFNDDFMQERVKANRDRLTPRELNYVFKQDFPPRIDQKKYLYVDDVLPWVHDNFMILRNAYLNLIKEKSFAEAKKLLKKYGHRFHGNPYLAVLKAEQAVSEGNFKKAEQIYHKIIDEESSTWINYHGLGQMYIAQERYDEAGKAFLSFPFFKGEKPYGYGNVTLSNYSYYAGEALFSHGAYKQAKKLFDCCISFNTGSQSDLASHIRLALMDNDFKTATFYAFKRAKRYNSSEAYGQYLTFLHLQGESDMAWALFYRLLSKNEKPDIWSSAIVGHRVTNTDFIGLSDWFHKIAEFDKVDEKRRYLARYGVLSLMDRKPNMKMVDVIKSVDDLSGYIIRKGTVNINNPMNETVGPGAIILNLEKDKKLRSNNVVKIPCYSSIARAYLLLQQKDYKNAFHVYEKRSINYDYRNEVYGKALQSYLVWAGIKSGHREKMAKFIELIRGRHKGIVKDFDLELAMAAFNGGIGNHKVAVKHLKNAFSVIPKVERRPQFPWYQLVELCEWLYEDSGNKSYKKLALMWAQKYQIMQPMFAWAYGVEAKYTTNSEDRIRALAFALYLDCQSKHISGFSKQEKAAASKWMEKHNPFVDNENRDNIQINGVNNAMNDIMSSGSVVLNLI